MCGCGLIECVFLRVWKIAETLLGATWDGLCACWRRLCPRVERAQFQPIYVIDHEMASGTETMPIYTPGAQP